MIPSQMLKGMLEGCILKIIQQRETYAYEISTQLEQYGFGKISEGTIYPVILRMQKNEFVTSVTRESSAGPKRKYYYLTEQGEKELQEFTENWKELDMAVNQLLQCNNQEDGEYE